ncbi:WD40 repeat-like protein [Gyrodon lividus]|nr:WD40 repeat-like protein [Gyrodon lividus]
MSVTPQTAALLDEVKDRIVSLSFSPNGHQVATGTTDGEIIIWDASCCQRLLEPWKGHERTVYSISYSSDSQTIVSASDDRTVRCWDSSNGQPKWQPFEGHTDAAALAAAFLRKTTQVVSVYKDGAVMLWQAQTGNVTHDFKISLSSTAITALSSGAHLLLGVHFNTVSVWRTETAEMVTAIDVGGPMVVCAVFSPDALHVLLGMGDYALRTWTINMNGMNSGELAGHENPPVYLAWSLDGRTIASSAMDGLLRVWDADTRESLIEARELHGPIAYSPDSKLIASPAADGCLEIIQAPELPATVFPGSGSDQIDEVSRRSRARGDHVLDLPVTSRPSASGRGGGRQSLEDAPAKPGLAMRIWAGIRRVKWAAKSNGNDQVPRTTVASGKYKDVSPVIGGIRAILTLLVIQPVVIAPRKLRRRKKDAKKQQAATTERPRSPAQNDEAAASSDGSHSAPSSLIMPEVTIESDNDHGCCDRPLSNLVSQSAGPYIYDWLVVIGTIRENLAVGNAASTMPLTLLLTTCQWIPTTAAGGYSPSGAHIVGGTTDASLFVWDSSGRCVLGPIKGHGMLSIIYHVSFVTESLILSTADDLTARLWDARTGERLKSFRKHQDSVITAARLPDQRTIASVSKDGAVMLWDMDTLEVVDEFEIRLDRTSPIAFSPDGTRLVGITQRTVYAWDVQRGQMITQATLALPMLLSATFSSDGHQVIFGCGDDVLRCWDVDSGEITGNPFEGHEDIPGYLACSPDGKLIASAASDGLIHVWNIEERKSVAKLEGNGPVAISSDSRYLVHPGAGNNVVITDLSSIIKSGWSSFLNLPATGIPQRSKFNVREGEAGISAPKSFLDSAATSRSFGRIVTDGACNHRMNLTPEAETKAGGRLSRIWKKLSRRRSRGNRDRRGVSPQEKRPVDRVAAARDRNKGSKRKSNQNENKNHQPGDNPWKELR